MTVSMIKLHCGPSSSWPDTFTAGRRGLCRGLVCFSWSLLRICADVCPVVMFTCPGARFNKEVQPTRSLNLNSELSYSEMGNSRVFGYRTAELC